MYVVFELNGRQYDGFIGQKVIVDLLSATDKTVKIDKLLLVKKSDEDILVGKPYIQGAEISADIRENFKDTKVIVYKYKKRKKFRKKKGHRQQYTVIFLNNLKTPGFTIDAAAIEDARKAEAKKWHDINMKDKAGHAKSAPAEHVEGTPAHTAPSHAHTTHVSHAQHAHTAPAKGHKKHPG
jgi:large subunit ribosomal protein L21